MTAPIFYVDSRIPRYFVLPPTTFALLRIVRIFQLRSVISLRVGSEHPADVSSFHSCSVHFSSRAALCLFAVSGFLSRPLSRRYPIWSSKPRRYNWSHIRGRLQALSRDVARLAAAQVDEMYVRRQSFKIFEVERLVLCIDSKVSK